ncbi:auxin-responsive protein SAUR76-like [Zingiber officinale]|uniref:auxin-responsive protein SAUR76-like n=1 Tax=Zingiber officinale TaxID=94328 RepID=UPI001C4AB2EE|nr:auxin-responsive protein SAUR76-like [Zingiber officinale]
MAGKLHRIKSMLKRWHSSSRLIAADDGSTQRHGSTPAVLHPVYVGKSRRRYLISSPLVEHRLFQVLARRSAADPGAAVVVGCEVVLFEHLLWMLENGDPPPESIDELVELYAC